jgi:CheY-like chemotaxis protein
VTGLHVLVAEDNPINQKVIVRMLTKLGCQACLAVDGEDAVRLYKQGSFEIVLMDCQMPDVDGYEAAGRIREFERHQSLARTPILALTAHAMTGDRERCLRSGMDDHLIKPLSFEVLRLALEKWGTIRLYGAQAS